MDAAARHRDGCHGSDIRLFIVNGTVWVDHLSPRPDPGWYPAGLGEGVRLVTLFSCAQSYLGVPEQENAWTATGLETGPWQASHLTV